MRQQVETTERELDRIPRGLGGELGGRKSALIGHADRNKRFRVTYSLRNMLLPKVISGEMPAVAPRSNSI